MAKAKAKSDFNALPREAIEADFPLLITTINDAITAHAVPSNRVDFARDLLKTYNKTKHWSTSQEWWARFIYSEALGILDYGPKPSASVEVGDFSKVYDLIQTAKAHLKYPKIVLQAPDGGDIVLKMSGPTSKMPGQINITDGKPFGENKWYGRVDSTGQWTQNHKIPEEELTSVGNVLKQLGDDPVGTAKKYATLTGNCCFCNIPLTDPHSTAAGFGPVCAKHFGLYDAWKSAKPVL